MKMNERGIITVDYLIAIVLVMGFTAILFSLSLTLTVAEVTQYVTFASARNYFAGHLNEDRQREQGQAKYQELVTSSVLAPLYKGGWFEVSPEAIVGDIGESGAHAPAAYQQDGGGEEKHMFVGSATPFVARILDIQIPMFGSTDPDSDGSGTGFKTFIASYVGREPTVAECMTLTANRWTMIRNKVNQTMGNAVPTNTVAIPIDDNGC